MNSDLVFREADPTGDDELARIMYNAFLPIWNHNWFQCLTSPLEPIPSTTSPLTPPQARRLAFYRSWFRLVRIHAGTVGLAYTPSPTNPAPPSSNLPSSNPRSSDSLFTTSPSNTIASIVLLLPPHGRPTWFEPLTAYRAGLLTSLLSLGLRGVWRVCVTFEGNVERLISSGLKAHKTLNTNTKQESLIMCHGCVRNPEWEGRGPGRRLLDWAVQQWWERERARGERPTPVWLDTSIDEAVRAYEEIGFEVLGEVGVETGCDAVGIKLKAGASEEERKKARERSRQWVMLRVPPEWEKVGTGH